MENAIPLPVKLMGVKYYLRPGFFGGDYMWSGDLVITSTTIYYFPVIDLEKQRKERPEFPGGLLGFLILELLEWINGKEISFFTNLHNTNELDSQVRNRLDMYFEKQQEGDDFLKASILEGRNNLPKPMRFKFDEISNIQMDKGKLSFNSVADTHDFAFPVRETSRVKIGIEHAGFQSVWIA